MRLYELLAEWSNWGWPLLANHLWQAALFSLLALAAVTALRRAPAATRYAVWLIALIMFALPSSLLAFLAREAGVDLSAVAFPAPARPEADAASAIDFTPILFPVSGPGPVLSPAASPARAAEQAAVPLAAAAQGGELFYCALTCVWLIGFSVLLVAWLRRRRWLSAALRLGREACAGPEAEALRRVRSRFGLRRRVGLVITPAVSEPGVWGVWRPVVLLPEGVTEHLDGDELEAVLAHELAHVERWDNLVGNVQMALRCLFWFHPVIWLVDRRLLDEREQACDDAVVRLGGSSGVYANGIAKICRYCLGREVAGLSRASGSDLKKRVERIVSGRAGRRASALHFAVVGVTAAGALTFSAAAGRAGGGFDKTREVETTPSSDARFQVGDAAPAPGRPGLTEVPRESSAGVGGLRVENVPGLISRKETPSTVAQPGLLTEPPVVVEASTGPVENQVAAPVAELPASDTPPPPPPAQPPADDLRAPVVKASDFDAGDLKEFVGRYEVDPERAENFILDVTLERGGLWLKPSHAPRRRLVRQSETDFSDAYSKFSLTFILDGAGRVAGLRLNSWGRNDTARKLTLPPPALKGNTTFRLRGFQNARVVALAGTFNNWNQSRLLFAREGDEWVCRVNLPPGVHQYKFVVDGDWLTDPLNPETAHDERGIENSLLRTE